MKLAYYPETDSLYIDFAAKPSAASREVSEGVVIDYDAGEKHVPSFKWAGALKDLRDRYTSGELQHKANDWRSGEECGSWRRPGGGIKSLTGRRLCGGPP